MGPEADEDGGGGVHRSGERAFRRNGAHVLDRHGAVVGAALAVGEQIEAGQAQDLSRHGLSCRVWFVLRWEVSRLAGNTSRSPCSAAMGWSFTSQHEGVKLEGNRHDLRVPF